MQVSVPIKTYGGKETEILKIAVYAETDAKGTIFYKIEGQWTTGRSAIAFIYNLDEAVKEFSRTVREILEKQTRELDRQKE